MDDEKSKKWKKDWHRDSGGGLYFVGFIGALVYYFQQANTFSDGVLGFLKACVWPAMLVYKLLGQ